MPPLPCTVLCLTVAGTLSHGLHYRLGSASVMIVTALPRGLLTSVMLCLSCPCRAFACASSPSPPSPSSESLYGLGISGGVVIGTARVVASLSASGEVQAGDILITHSTSPAWTPLFSLVRVLFMSGFEVAPPFVNLTTKCTICLPCGVFFESACACAPVWWALAPASSTVPH